MENKKPVLWNDLFKSVMRLPSMGVSNAKKISVALMSNKELLREFIDAMERAYKEIQICKQCGNFGKTEVCEICSSGSARKKDVLCVVKGHVDMYAVEASLAHDGTYYILGENFSPAAPSDTAEKIKSIIRENACKEVILAFSSSIEGSILSHYMKILLKDTGVKITRPSVGMPINADIESIGPDTLQIALKNRCE